MLYQCEPGVEKYFETEEYWRAVMCRQTWDPARGFHTYDDVCTTQIFSIKSDAESCGETEDCACWPFPVYTLDRVRWTEKDERTWLTRGFVPSRTQSVLRHQRWAHARSYRNQLIK